MSAATVAAATAVWPADLGPADWVHPRWCRRLAGCETGHRSATYAVGPVLVWAEASVTWQVTVHVVGAVEDLTPVQALRLRLLTRHLSDPGGVR